MSDEITTIRVVIPGVNVVRINVSNLPSAGAPVAVVFSNPGGRLTTESGVPVSTSDRTAQGTLYYTPYLHNNIYTYSGAAWQRKTFSEISLLLTITSGKNYDVFIDSAASTLSLSNPWTNDTTRADALGTQDGVTVLGSDHTKLWIGTIRASGANVTEDSLLNRFAWNAYNGVPRSLNKYDISDNHTYGTAVWREWNNAVNGPHALSFVTGRVQDFSSGGWTEVASDGTNTAYTSLGLNSTSTEGNASAGSTPLGEARIGIKGDYSSALGFNRVTLVEYATAGSLAFNYYRIMALLIN